MHLHSADVKPGSRKEGSEDGIELTIENGQRAEIQHWENQNWWQGQQWEIWARRSALEMWLVINLLKNQRDMNVRLVPVGLGAWEYLLVLYSFGQ